MKSLQTGIEDTYYFNEDFGQKIPSERRVTFAVPPEIDQVEVFYKSNNETTVNPADWKVVLTEYEANNFVYARSGINTHEVLIDDDVL